MSWPMFEDVVNSEIELGNRSRAPHVVAATRKSYSLHGGNVQTLCMQLVGWDEG